MTAPFIREDSKFCVDNLLGDDWDASPHTGGKLDDFPGLLDLEANLSSDLMPELDLELPMLDDHGLGGPELPLVDPWKDLSDGSDSGVECVSIKQEPGSPALSHTSDGSSDSNQQALMDFLPVVQEPIQLDPPPLVTVKTEPASPQAGSLPGQTTVVLPGGISRVLNSKVKIQPKPATSIIPPKASPPAGSTAPGKPLILTAEEFANLTAQGVLKFSPPANSPSTQTTASAVPQTGLTATVAASNSIQFTTLAPQDNDLKTLKRQQRMIKNRESASLSRKRKKEYLSSLEQRLHDFTAENEKLRYENHSLKRKIDDLENENQKLRKGVTGVSMKKVAVCLMAVSFLFTINIGPLSLWYQSSNSRFMEPVRQGIVHHGRTLMSVEETNLRNDPINFSQPKVPQARPSSVHVPRKASSASRLGVNGNNRTKLFVGADQPTQTCPMYFNMTESQRLADDLTGWVMGHKEMKKKQTEKRRRRSKHKEMLRQKNQAQFHFRDMAWDEGSLSYQPKLSERKNPYQVKVFTGADRSYMDFLDAIHRRNDTFYVVSFSRDHLLLPATAHNKTMRPRMSLVMPAVSLNETMQPPLGSIAMMQIDCEVMDTRLIHIRRAVVPQNKQENNTSPTMMSQNRNEKEQWTPPRGRPRH